MNPSQTAGPQAEGGSSGPGDGDRPRATGIPDIGAILRRLRQQRRLSIRQVAEASDLSPSFISAVERGKTDIAVTRLAQLAEVFDHDVGSLLGYSERQARPRFVSPPQRMRIDRGEGISYEAIPIPGTQFQLTHAVLEPKSYFEDEMKHEGLDILFVVAGDVVLTYNGVDYPMSTGTCGVWSGAYPHTFRNDTDTTAEWISMVTGTVF